MSAVRLPALFIGHGSPMNALEDNAFTRAWSALGEAFPKPQAIVAISAHWETKGLLITAATQQRTIHDFYNFPPELYAVEYPAPGAPDLARKLEAMLSPYARADLDSWGLDHGTWSVLKFMYPAADIPVVQVSMDIRLSLKDHYRIGQIIGTLRDQNILVLGSGNIVHNLQHFKRHSSVPIDWASRFNNAVKRAIKTGDHQALLDLATLSPDAALAVPEAEHYQPLLYVLGTQHPGETATFLTDTVLSAISMTSVAIGL